MFCSRVSGSKQVVAARSSIRERMVDACNYVAPAELVPSTFVHIDPQDAYPPLASNKVCVGNGVPGCQYFAPSIWSDPFVNFEMFD